MIRSPLIEFQDASEETVAPYHGAIVPARYSSEIAEYQAVRSAAGLFDFSFRAQFSATGSDRVRFIHGMVSNDVRSLKPGKGIYAAILDVRGHILADVRIYCCDDRLLLETDADLVQKAIETLNRYNIGGRVPLERLDLAALAIQGPASKRILQEMEIPLPAPEEYSHVAAPWNGADLRVIRASITGEEGYELWLPTGNAPELWRALLDRGRAAALAPCGWRALETLRIEAGIPMYGSELGEDTLPLEAGLMNALSFNKGCYIGQEIVERARSRGRVNWQLAGLTLDGAAPAPGEKLSSDGKEAGEITSACDSPSLGKPVALGYLRREFAEPGTRVSIASGGEATVAALPFHNRGGADLRPPWREVRGLSSGPVEKPRT